MLKIRTVQQKERDLLWNINQKYLYEMTLFYPDRMDENGNYHYGYFDEYFTDPKRKAFFLYEDDMLAGFALLCPYSNIGCPVDYTLAEFTIFPSFRRKHLALDAANRLLRFFPGNWEIKFNERNTAARKLWTTIAQPFAPTVHHLNEEETVLAFSVSFSQNAP